MTYILTKLSEPGWEMKSDDISHIRWMLDEWVCDSCKFTREQYDEEEINFFKSIAIQDNEEEYKFMQECLVQNINPTTHTDFFPEGYKNLPDKEQIDLLLSTACGCEFYYVDTNDSETGKKFVEINDE